VGPSTAEILWNCFMSTSLFVYQFNLKPAVATMKKQHCTVPFRTLIPQRSDKTIKTKLSQLLP